MAKPLIYAELLSNIRQISIIAVLDTPSDVSTNVALAGNRQQVILHHHGISTSLNLPGQLAPKSHLQKPLLGNKELSWRLPLTGQVSRPDDATSNEAPWPARSLTAYTEFCCRACRAKILTKGIIKSWKDLPSENWAEMMDFWHCHKPDVPEANGHGHFHDDPSVNKAYGANAKFTARSGVGFVDLTTFLVNKSDCTRAEVENAAEQDSKYPKLICSSCRNYLGHLDHQAEGYRLYKWQLKSPATTPDKHPYYEPSLSSIITAQLQSVMLAQCCSRLVFLPTNWKPTSAPQSPSPQSTFLSMWILSPTIRYSTTVQAKPTSSPGTLAMKIFWKSITATEANKLLDSSTHEEVSLPSETIIEIEKCLRGSAAFLPPSGRRFQDWDVGLLERFDGDGDTARDSTLPFR